jgi:hypothetical protein
MKKIISQNSKLDKQFFLVRLLFFTFLFVLCASISINAQDDDNMPADVAPPPLKLLSKDEKITLEAQGNNLKKRTKVSLELMDARMDRAEKSNSATDFKQSLDELAGFNAILDNTLSFLIKNDSGKADRSFINFEIYLRKQIPRLETIRREMPVKYGFHVGRIMKAVREARAKAVEPIFDDTVVPTATKKP